MAGKDVKKREPYEVVERLLEAFYTMHENGEYFTEDGVMASQLIMAAEMDFADSPPPTYYLNLMIRADLIEVTHCSRGSRLQLTDTIMLAPKGMRMAKALRQRDHRVVAQELRKIVIEVVAEAAKRIILP